MAQRKLRCTRNTTSDVITQLDMLRVYKYQGRRKNRVANLKKCLLRQQDLFKKANKEKEAAVEASYVVSEMIAKAGKPFKEGEFIKNRFAGITTDGAPSMTGRKNGLVALVQSKWKRE
ncbi:hypothetical protein FQN60_004233 [Etheostoma spectabile]|uniref:Uncharacterized protein n=1 Tax=Etheostoma spectabile TaxID=54343 RepID=A0A5J5CWK9_9PERO|nr:hypothetical protein FQN60_004233 [Etheostoma spectabile]